MLAGLSRFLGNARDEDAESALHQQLQRLRSAASLRQTQGLYFSAANLSFRSIDKTRADDTVQYLSFMWTNAIVETSDEGKAELGGAQLSLHHAVSRRFKLGLAPAPVFRFNFCLNLSFQFQSCF